MALPNATTPRHDGTYKHYTNCNNRLFDNMPIQSAMGVLLSMGLPKIGVCMAIQPCPPDFDVMMGFDVSTATG